MMDTEIFFQLIINAISVSALYMISAIGIKLIYTTSKFINISIAFYFLLSPYIIYYLHGSFEVDLFLSIVFSFIFSVITALFIQIFVFQKLIYKSPLILLITSIGVYITLQSSITIFFGEDVRIIEISKLTKGISIFGARSSYVRLYGISLSIIVVILTYYLNKSKIGLMIKAVSSNRFLAQVFGIKLNVIILLATIYGVTLVSSVGILVAFDLGVTPHSGFDLFIFALVTIIIGGTGRLGGLIAASLFIAIVQQLAAYYIDSMWKDTIAYFILIIFLLWKPLGFVGQQLKKVEI